MIYYMHNVNKKYIASIDIEYDNGDIIQIGSIMLKKIGKNIFQTCKSFNIYIQKDNLSKFIQEYTNINQDFLNEYGVSLEEAQALWKTYVGNIGKDDILFVSHGINQDSCMLRNHGFNIDEFEHYCTYNMSRWVLERDNKLSLSDVMREGGLSPIQEHNAYADALATINVFSYLLKIEGGQNDFFKH